MPGLRVAERRVVHRQRRATLYSYVINHRPAPGFEDETPYAIAVVQLAEGPRMMTNLVGVPATPEALVLDMPLRVTFEQRGDVCLPVFTPPSAGGGAMSNAGVIIAGAAETDEIGRLPDHSTLALHIEAARNAVADAGLTMQRHRRHRDRLRAGTGPGRARARHHPALDRRHRRRRHLVPAARQARGRGHQGRLREDGPDHPRRVGPVPGRRAAVPAGDPSSPPGQFEAPYGTFGPTTTFTIPVLRYMKDYGLTHEQLAYVAVAQRHWAAKNPRAMLPRPDHGRGRARLADGRLPVPPAGVLPGHRRRRRAGGHLGRPRGGLPQAAVHVLGTGFC